MGMAASQARLLSITARLTNNEFRAQTITNSKLRLASESEEVSNAYMEALDSKKLMYMFYDEEGTSNKLDLTPSLVYEYSPMKNQYAIKNASGKMLIRNQDAVNFNETEDLFHFLDRYDLVYDLSPAINEKRRADFQKWRDEKYADYERKHAEWEEIMKNWSGVIYNNEVYDKFAAYVGTSENPKAYCYIHALAGTVGCYLHLLNELLDFNGTNLERHTYDTSYTDPSTGNKAQVTTDAQRGWMWPGSSPYPSQEVPLDVMHDLSDELNNNQNTCDGSDRFTPYYDNNGTDDLLEWTDLEHGVKDNKNIIQQAIDDDGSISGRDPANKPTKYEILMSDYMYDPVTNSVKGLKTVKQKAIDLYYLIQHRSEFAEISNEVMKETLINFTEGDLKMVKTTEPPPEPQWIEPEPPEDIEGYFLVRDQKKAQWYTNMWFMLNGSDTANLVVPINYESENEFYETLDEDIKREYRFITDNKFKEFNPFSNYEILDTNLENSAEWFEFALEHGAVSIEQAVYYDPAEDSGKTAKSYADAITWKSIPYKTAQDIVSVDDENKKAQGEVDYKRRLTEIDNEDKKLDQDLRRLNTEHTALQTEYESIKEVINKNEERSFKAFS